MPLLQILCDMEEVDPHSLLDGDEVYYRQSYQQTDYRLNGPFTVVVDGEKYKLRNVNGGTFFLDSIAKVVKFYKRI